MQPIAPEQLREVTGGDGGDDRKFHGVGQTSTANECFAGLARDIAHDYNLRGPFKPIAATRPTEHLIYNKAHTIESGSAMWNNGQCDVSIY